MYVDTLWRQIDNTVSKTKDYYAQIIMITYCPHKRRCGGMVQQCMEIAFWVPHPFFAS